MPMNSQLNRRDFLKTAGVVGFGGAVYACGLTGFIQNAEAADSPETKSGSSPAGFFFVQLSDPHWGFNNPKINPDYAGTLKKAIVAVNALDPQPDFIVFTGDLTQTTDDDKERRTRMAEFRQIIKDLKVQTIKFLPGEHDAALDEGAAFKEAFGPTHWTFEHKGVHFIALDNVSDPHASLGDAQLEWFRGELDKLPKDTRIVVLTHRPLFDLADDWDWNTVDGDKAIDLLTPYPNVTVLYGHIHQLNHHMTGQLGHHSAMGLMWPLPAPHSVPNKAPIPWDPAHPYKGLGWREINASGNPKEYKLNEKPVLTASDPPAETIIKITAKKFEYSPNEITLKKGVPVVLELTSLDRLHGFKCPGLKIRSDIKPGKVNQLRFTPDKVGEFPFRCDNFCGSGHDRMKGKIIVKE
jgi:hypothetical protein